MFLLLFRTLGMDASQGSLVTIGLDGDDIMCADPELGQRALRNTINRMPDGTVILWLICEGLMWMRT